MGANNTGQEPQSKTIWWALVLGMLLALPCLWVGLQLDDYFHWGLVTQRSQVLQTLSPASPYGLFSFLDGDPARVVDMMNLGLVPWWTYPQVEYAFWRPLTELTHGLDYSLWPQTPMLMHLQSLIYFGIMLWLCFQLFKKIQGETSAWLWASFLFALSYSHGVPAGWLANRNSVLAVIFVILAIASHHRWREYDQSAISLRSCLLLVLGLLCGEMAVTAGAYLLSYALFYDKGDWRSRFYSLVPYAVVGLAWLSIRAILGYGASGSGHYLDPLSTPILFLEMLTQRVLVLVGGLFLVVPPELGSALPAYRIWVYLALFLLVIWVAWPLLKSDRRARFWLCGSLLCLIPVASTVPHSRLLIAASVGAAGFLGLLFVAWRNGKLRRSGLAGAATGIVAVLLMVLNLGLSSLLLPLEIVSMRLMGDNFLNNGAVSWNLQDLPQGATPILINPPLSSAGGYINGIRLYEELPVTAKTWLLASGTRSLKVSVLNQHTLDIESAEGLYDAQQEGVLRGPQAPFSVGDSVQLDGMIVTVMAVDEGVPTQARFQFAKPLNSDLYRFAHWHGGSVAPCRLPAKGAAIELKMNSEQCAMP
ncbi:hypothetical protein FT643_06310 [Ketobacter sp. MCCC 1A13808]|uniref:hypothetical protein n=1 Tax=Ketobacter sp. MCCC 1A13808 TaxID=2602738 RepID=UPI0012ECA004|nr:hypothetical protein [Ketobacter sp. MCCC 1A13808]MVF11755.1 hypothetical protein [Ketobacter sp. MCCC 1A13808]